MTHPSNHLRRMVASVAAREATILTAAADGIDRAVLAFDPDADLIGGLRRMNAAVAVANRAYLEIFGENLPLEKAA